MRATYSPEDNKIRIYPVERLDEATYNRLKSAGYKWAPSQKIFVAPMWTPKRAEIALEVCGHIGDEDSSLVERAEDRAERYETRSDQRANEAERTQSRVEDVIQGGAVTVGHHSRGVAEKEAKKIERTMERIVSLWDQADYWKDRAKGALRAAKYKERPDVRHRRIKGIEADKRKNEKSTAESFKFMGMWEKPNLTKDMALRIANYDHVSQCFPLSTYPRDLPASQYEGVMSVWSALNDGVIDEGQAARLALAFHQRRIDRARKWHDHYENRLAYERAMLDEQGGLITANYNIEVGGSVLYDNEWLIVLKVNKSMGKVNSVTTQPPSHCTWISRFKVGIENVKDYRAPTADTVTMVKGVTKRRPTCNFPGEGFREITKEEWAKIPGGHKGSALRRATHTHGAYNYKVVYVGGTTWKTQQVFITDAKVIMPPELEPTTLADLPRPAMDVQAHTTEHTTYQAQEERRGDKVRQALANGVTVVSANQLFLTPVELAKKMVDALDVRVGHRVLEPSAGTGRLLSALGGRMFLDGSEKGLVKAVEINATLARNLAYEFPLTDVQCCDFLNCTTHDLGGFDRIIMNPPFEKGNDIKHIQHALGFLKPGGVLVAICANGPRQAKVLKPLVSEWEDLPPQTFAESGTGVNTAMLTFHA